jgi:hypothetical protein
MAGTQIPFTSITSMTAHYGPIAPPLDLSLFENGHSTKDFLIPFLRLGKLSANSDKDAEHQGGNHKQREIEQSEHEDHEDNDEANYDLDHEEDHEDHEHHEDHDDHDHYHSSTQFDTHFDSYDSEDGSQSDHKMGIHHHP